MVHSDGQRVQHSRVDSLVLQVDDVHLLANALHGGLCAQLGQISTDITVGLLGNRLQVDVLSQLHVLGVNAQNLQAASRVGNANVNLAIEATEAAQGLIDRVGSVSGGHHNNVCTGLETVHQGQQLRHNAALNLTRCLPKIRR